ncbi:MAG TPA: dihydrolipoyl dehydrogenase [Steroidobacter sp.]|jgi:dihydrolipoamide dehydrogenase|nr:dihydrolipoyl dehydrogenase [Steroidobacter sp.]
MYDVVIIGAGTAGLSALREVRTQTDKFVIVNDGPYGTTCARVGCMPSKALIESANALHRRTHFEELGVRGAEALHADLEAVLQRVRTLRDRFAAGIVKITDDLGRRSIAGRARFTSPESIEVNGRRLDAKRFIIATGSHPIVPQAWTRFGERVLTSDTLFEQQTLPPRMAVVGLGVIGCELAQALARLGVQITAFGAGRALGGLEDPLVYAHASALLSAEFDLRLHARAELEAEGAHIRVRAGAQTAVVDSVLAALGRRPNVHDLGLERLGVELDEHGMPPFDPRSLQIEGVPIYFAGDVNAQWPVLHEAADDGYVSGYNAPRSVPECFRRRTPLAIVFTDPNIAVVGQRFSTLDQNKIAIGAVDFAQQGRALIAAENRGALRVYAARTDGRLLGAELCAPRGEHLAHLLALAIAQRLTVHELLGAPFYHPVYEEGLRTALRDCARQSAAAPVSDLANCGFIGATALD